MLSSFLHTLIPHSPFWHQWQDSIEIIFFCFTFYAISIWLQKDRQKPLLLYFYGYCFITIAAYYTNLSTLTTVLFFSAPATSMLFILLHQTTLQKNIITPKKYVPAQQKKDDWLETFFRSCLIAMNNNTPVLCVIEHTDALNTFLTTPLPLSSPIQEQLLSLLFSSSVYDPEKLVWITTQGTLCGINATWNSSYDPDWQKSSLTSTVPGYHNALFFTQKTDALIFYLDPNKRSISLFIQGTLFENISIQQTLQRIKNYVRKTSIPTGHKGARLDETHKKSFTQKHSH